VKWLFVLALLVLTPALAISLRQRPRYLLPAAFLVGLMPFVMSPLHLYVAPVSWAGWPGAVKGIELSLLDALAIAIIAATKPVKTPLVLKFAVGIILVALCVSTIASGQFWPCMFYAWQFLRAVLVYMAVARATAALPAAPIQILFGMGLGLAIEAVTAAWQFMGGAIQAGGNFGHQNLLGMASLFVVLPAFALLLAGRRTALALGIVTCEAIIVYAGGSRATVGLAAIGLLVAIALSVWHRGSGRKAMAGAAAIIALVCAAPVMMLAIERRPEALRVASNDERQRFDHAARMIIADNPLGVGANRYVIVANLGGYSDRAGVPWNTSQRAAPVHNFYYLFAAELGLLGLIGLFTLQVGIILVGIRSLKRAGWSERSELLVGATTAAIAASAYFAFEWIAMTFYIHYLFAINTGIIVALSVTDRSAVPRRDRRPLALKVPAVQTR